MEIGRNAKRKAINAGGSSVGVAKVTKIGKETQDRISAKWDDANNLFFVELLEEEIEKGNKPGNNLSRAGWKNVVESFNKRTRRIYNKKQLRNHWDAMKREWSLFKQLINNETGLGWNEAKKTIQVDNAWWEAKILINDRFAKFGDKDLSLLWFHYGPIFDNIVATGDRTRAPCQVRIPSQESNDEHESSCDSIDISDVEVWHIGQKAAEKGAKGKLLEESETDFQARFEKLKSLEEERNSALMYFSQVKEKEIETKIPLADTASMSPLQQEIHEKMLKEILQK